MLFWLSADQVVVGKLNDLLNSYSESDKKEIFDGMKLPTKLSYSNIQESEFDTLVDFAVSDGFESIMFKNKVTDFSNKYIWFPFEYGGPEIYDVETVIKRVQEHIKKGDKIETHSEEEIINHQNDIIKKYNLNDEIIFHFKIIQTLALMQDDRKAVNARACYFVNNLVLSKLSKIIGLPIKDLFLIDPWLLDEYIDIEDLSGLKERIEKRNEMFLICLDENDKIAFKEGIHECTSFLNNLDITINEKVVNNSIVGKVAYPGKVTGIARVVKKSSECSMLNDGEILVTYMTTPDFVPFLKRASAVVTEEGGITCHAAIVARELKKPCITGTGNVMSIIKDGDMIEVDANNGIVRIIK
jgi:phosphohistidine swiveling domain-containing protein